MIVLTILDWVGWISSALVVLSTVVGSIAWARGVFPALWRLGNGLSKRKIAIFAKGDNLINLRSMLLDSKLFNNKNIIDITSDSDLGRAEQTTLFLVYWHDWQNNISEILSAKKDTTALIVYAPQDLGFIPKDKMQELDKKRNVTVANLRGRLLNDIVVSLMTTSYQ